MFSGESVEYFYRVLADHYHQMYADWKSEVLRQGEVLDALIRSLLGSAPCRLLDCTCGIGTQAIGLAAKNYRVHATDLVAAAVDRARDEARAFGVTVTFDVADVRALDARVTDVFDAVVSFDNAVSHLLEDADLLAAADQMRRRLRKDGVVLISIRDYDQVIQEKRRSSEERPLPGVVAGTGPLAQPTMPRVFDDASGRRVIFQIWDWTEDERSYRVNHFHLVESEGKWETNCYVTRFRAIQRDELTSILRAAGFSDVRWLMPAESGYYQPIVVAYNR